MGNDKRGFDNMDEKTVVNAVETAREVLGDSGAKDVEKIISDKEKMRQIFSRLDASDTELIMKIIGNHDLLRKVLSSPKAAEGIKKLLGGDQ